MRLANEKLVLSYVIMTVASKVRVANYFDMICPPTKEQHSLEQNGHNYRVLLLPYNDNVYVQCFMQSRHVSAFSSAKIRSNVD